MGKWPKWHTQVATRRLNRTIFHCVTFDGFSSDFGCSIIWRCSSLAIIHRKLRFVASTTAELSFFFFTLRRGEKTRKRRVTAAFILAAHTLASEGRLEYRCNEGRNEWNQGEGHNQKKKWRRDSPKRSHQDPHTAHFAVCVTINAGALHTNWKFLLGSFFRDWLSLIYVNASDCWLKGQTTEMRSISERNPATGDVSLRSFCLKETLTPNVNVGTTVSTVRNL